MPVPSLAEQGKICHWRSRIACKFSPCVISTTLNAFSKSWGKLERGCGWLLWVTAEREQEAQDSTALYAYLFVGKYHERYAS